MFTKYTPRILGIVLFSVNVKNAKIKKKKVIVNSFLLEHVLCKQTFIQHLTCTRYDSLLLTFVGKVSRATD